MIIIILFVRHPFELSYKGLKYPCGYMLFRFIDNVLIFLFQNNECECDYYICRIIVVL